MEVILREGESSESLLSRFRASVACVVVLRELKDRRLFRSKGGKEQLAAAHATRRRLRRAYEG